MVQWVKKLTAIQETQVMLVHSMGWEDPLEEHGNPLQHFCLKNPMDRGTWQATVQRVTKSETSLSTHACLIEPTQTSDT